MDQLTMSKSGVSRERSAKLGEFYKKIYKSRSKHDSPDKSRTSLARRMVRRIRQYPQGGVVVNLGAGPQALERELIINYAGSDSAVLKNYLFCTVDNAISDETNLLARKIHNVLHLDTDAAALPIADNLANLVVSNHAIDLMPVAAFAEARRILNENGQAIFYFHHPEMIESIDFVDDPDIVSFWTYLRQEQVLFESEEEIERFLSETGFEAIEVLQNSDFNDKWWEVVAGKK